MKRRTSILAGSGLVIVVCCMAGFCFKTAHKEPAPVPPPAPVAEAVRHSDVDFGPYMARLQRSMKRAWFPPPGKETCKVTVVFKVHDDGAMSNLRLTKSSGSALADQAALKAVINAAPFKALPKGAPEDVDIQFTFDYNVFKGPVKNPIKSL
ncbi:TonB family protein [bacterium]|nr:TonB family protein [bacterium]